MSSDDSDWSATPTKGRPRPAMSRDTEFFWKGAREHRLLAQKCLVCGTVRHPPGPSCDRCHSLDWEPVELSGRATLFTFTVHRHPPLAAFEHPPIIGVGTLEEGPRLIANVVGADPDDLTIGEELEVFFVDQEEGWSVPQFRRPTSADAQRAQ